jgi:predicted nucleic acid-binding protein
VTIVDSTVWIDYFRGRETAQTDWLDAHAATDPIGLTDLILCEVLQGVRDERLLPKLQKDLSAFQFLDGGGANVALAAAANYRALRRRGRTVRGTIDCLIATFCMMNGHSLLHDDRDYDAFEQELGLAVVHP